MKTFSVFDLEAAAKCFAPLPQECTDLLHAMRTAEEDLGFAEVYMNVLDDGKFRADVVYESGGASGNECDSPAEALCSLYHGYGDSLPPLWLRNMAEKGATA